MTQKLSQNQESEIGLIDLKLGSWAQYENLNQSGSKLEFQKTLSGLTKMAIAQWFLDQLTQIVLQMEA